MIYSIFVGHYDSPKVSKTDLKKLNSLGLVGYLFSKGDFFSLKIASTLNKEQALTLRKNLELKGFESYIEESPIKR